MKSEKTGHTQRERQKRRPKKDTKSKTQHFRRLIWVGRGVTYNILLVASENTITASHNTTATNKQPKERDTHTNRKIFLSVVYRIAASVVDGGK